MSERGRIVVVTGLSGAGKSTALHALEDLGYFCVDNLPTSLAPQAVDVCEAGGIDRIALGIDVRVRAFLEGAKPALERIRAGGEKRDVVVLFLDASDEALLRRFSETRRPHPLSSESSGPPPSGLIAQAGAPGVLDGVHFERERLAPLRAQATIDLDTTRLSVHDLRRQVIAHLGPGRAEQFRMTTRFVSFGYKYGVPVDADIILDVRFLDNPFFVPELKPLPGTDAAVRAFLLALPEANEFLQRTEDLLAFCLPRYEREGKSYLTVGIGCTGGRHRSVAIAALLSERLSARLDLPISVAHRDVLRTANVWSGRSPEGRDVGSGRSPEGRDLGDPALWAHPAEPGEKGGAG